MANTVTNDADYASQYEEFFAKSMDLLPPSDDDQREGQLLGLERVDINQPEMDPDWRRLEAVVKFKPFGMLIYPQTPNGFPPGSAVVKGVIGASQKSLRVGDVILGISEFQVNVSTWRTMFTKAKPPFVMIIRRRTTLGDSEDEEEKANSARASSEQAKDYCEFCGEIFLKKRDREKHKKRCKASAASNKDAILKTTAFLSDFAFAKNESEDDGIYDIGESLPVDIGVIPSKVASTKKKKKKKEGSIEDTCRGTHVDSREKRQGLRNKEMTSLPTLPEMDGAAKKAASQKIRDDSRGTKYPKQRRKESMQTTDMHFQAVNSLAEKLVRAERRRKKLARTGNFDNEQGRKAKEKVVRILKSLKRQIASTILAVNDEVEMLERERALSVATPEEASRLKMLDSIQRLMEREQRRLNSSKLESSSILEERRDIENRIKGRRDGRRARMELLMKWLDYLENKASRLKDGIYNDPGDSRLDYQLGDRDYQGKAFPRRKIKGYEGEFTELIPDMITSDKDRRIPIEMVQSGNKDGTARTKNKNVTHISPDETGMSILKDILTEDARSHLRELSKGPLIADPDKVNGMHSTGETVSEDPNDINPPGRKDVILDGDVSKSLKEKLLNRALKKEIEERERTGKYKEGGYLTGRIVPLSHMRRRWAEGHREGLQQCDRCAEVLPDTFDMRLHRLSPRCRGVIGTGDARYVGGEN